MFGIRKWSAVLAMTAMACATTASTPSIYYKSQAQADAALAAFDKDNPSCQLWTNWQKMCSRTAKANAVKCIIDPEMPVRPSVPFCVGDLNGSSDGQSNPHKNQFKYETIPFTTKLQAEIVSANRFCSEYPSHSDKYLLSDGSYLDARQCLNDNKHRPFNSRNLAITRHPWCNVWSDATTQRPVCAEGSKFPELPRCEKLADAEFKSNNQLYCSRELDLYGTEPVDGCWDISSALSNERHNRKLPSYPHSEPDEIADTGKKKSSREIRFSQIFCNSWNKIDAK